MREEPIEWRQIDAPYETWTVTVLPGTIHLVLTANYEPNNYETMAWAGLRASARMRVVGVDVKLFERVAESIDDAKDIAERWARSFLESTAAEVAVALSALGPRPWTCKPCTATEYCNADHERCIKVSVQHVGIGRPNHLTLCACHQRGCRPGPMARLIEVDAREMAKSARTKRPETSAGPVVKLTRDARVPASVEWDVLRQLASDVVRVGTLSCDVSPVELMACRALSDTGLVEWRVGLGYAITAAGRAALRG